VAWTSWNCPGCRAGIPSRRRPGPAHADLHVRDERRAEAVRCTHEKHRVPRADCWRPVRLDRLTRIHIHADVHSNASSRVWAWAWPPERRIALRAIARVRVPHGCASLRPTYANYVGKPLSYVLATPACDDDRDNPLRIVFGNEARRGRRRSARGSLRGDRRVRSTEGGIVVSGTRYPAGVETGTGWRSSHPNGRAAACRSVRAVSC